jgi:MATE family multidrug resistance protein
MQRLRRELRRLVELAVPVVIAQVGMNLLGFVDTAMVGRLDVTSLAAASLGHVWTFATLIFAMGAAFGIDPIVTQAHGAREPERMGRALQRGFVIALALSLPTALFWWWTEPALRLLGQEPHLAQMARDYCRVQIPGLPFFLCFLVLRQYLQGRTIVRPTLWVVIVANLLNVFLNWVLIFGHLGVPRLELLGAGMATGLSRIFLFVALLWLCLRGRLFEGGWTAWTKRSFRLTGLWEVLRFGLPFGLQFSLEVWAFQIALLLAGRLGEVPLAAHTVVITMASISFMFPFGVSQAAVIRVGNLIGAGRIDQARRAGWVALGLGGGVMAVFAILFSLARHQLPWLISKDATVAVAAAGILPIAAAFQLFDGLQAVGCGVLRGAGSTRPAMFFNLFGYYAFALPLAYWLTFEQGYGLMGLWWGLALAVAVIAVALVLWVRAHPPRGPIWETT